MRVACKAARFYEHAAVYTSPSNFSFRTLLVKRFEAGESPLSSLVPDPNIQLVQYSVLVIY
eukprot:SAG11_NODE_17103_length_528_cov_1.207459_1_plen_61_part_00